jgi:hypothetical protein
MMLALRTSAVQTSFTCNIVWVYGYRRRSPYSLQAKLKFVMSMVFTRAEDIYMAP